MPKFKSVVTIVPELQAFEMKFWDLHEMVPFS